MRKLDVDLNRCPPELRQGLAEIMAERPERFAAGGEAVAVSFERDASLGGSGLAVSKDARAIQVRYARRCDAFRALGRLLGESESDRHDFTETSRFDVLGIMVDCSRNGVLRPESAKALMRRCALMGLNMMMLYTEDTYEVPGEPFFGYLRGRYTGEELKDLDDYADALGIEMIPCIQTLAHLEQILQWPAYDAYRDTDHVLIAEEERTYALVERMIAAAAAPFRSKRIHIGMDEAHGIGAGRYKERHGDKRPFDILNAHLKRVRDICTAQGLKPMIWSDMYFRLGSRTNDYYDREAAIPPDVASAIPRDVELVYWDYYHTDADFYAEWIDRHRALGSEPIMAGGVWTWNHFWAALPFSFTTVEACMSACKEKKLRQAFVTLWGDDGMECDVFSALPGMQLFAEHGYQDAVDGERLAANFRGSSGADLHDCIMAAELDSVPCISHPSESAASVSKWLLWQDPLLALMDPQFEGASLRDHYSRLADALSAAAAKTPFARRLEFPARMAKALSLKCDLRRHLADAYRAGDRKRLGEILHGDLAALRKAVDALWRSHRDMWIETYKPFGLEVVEGRYGALRTRLETVADRISGYLDGTVKSIPELEVTLERAFDTSCDQIANLTHARLHTPSCIK